MILFTDCIRYHYDHTSLLFDMGRNEEASQNWLKMRNVDQTKKTIITNTKRFDVTCMELYNIFSRIFFPN